MLTEEFILEVTKVMIPVLTGFLFLSVKAISPYWKIKRSPQRKDFLWVGAISILAFLSFGCWAGALAGAMIHTTNGPGSIIPWAEVSSEEALKQARVYVACAYSFFVFSVFVTGAYYFSLILSGGYRAPDE